MSTRTGIHGKPTYSYVARAREGMQDEHQWLTIRFEGGNELTFHNSPMPFIIHASVYPDHPATQALSELNAALEQLDRGNNDAAREHMIEAEEFFKNFFRAMHDLIAVQPHLEAVEN